MASDRMKQALERLERAISRAEVATRQIAEERQAALEAELSADPGGHGPPGVDIDPYSRDKAIAALKSLDSLIGDLQKARGDG